MKRASLIVIAISLCMIPFSAEALEERHDTDPSSDCLADWDPFCPQGTPTGGGGGTYPSICHYCEMTPTGGKCSQVAEGETGRTDCTNTYVGTDPVYCQTSGSFCENITVTP